MNTSSQYLTLALILSLLCVNAYAVKIGDDESVVLTELGKPNSVVKLAPTIKIIGYEHGDVIISQGKVVKIYSISVEQPKAHPNSDLKIGKDAVAKIKNEEQNTEVPDEATAVKNFASLICYIPEEPMDNGLGLGRVDVVANGNDLALVLDIIDNTPRHGGSGYLSFTSLLDSNGRVLAQTPRMLLPVNGGKVVIPVKNFILRDENYPRNHPTSTIQQAQLLDAADVVSLTSKAKPDVLNAGPDYSTTYRSIKQLTK